MLHITQNADFCLMVTVLPNRFERIPALQIRLLQGFSYTKKAARGMNGLLLGECDGKMKAMKLNETGANEMKKACIESVTVQKVDKDTELMRQLLCFVENFSWAEVREHTLRVISRWEFEEWETPFAAVLDGRIVGMGTVMKTDYYPLPEIFPWVSTLFVSEEYRGNGICGRLIAFANDYAGKIGFEKTYIPTEYTGLYEKYGYRHVRDIVNYAGGMDRLYVRETGRNSAPAAVMRQTGEG